MNDSTELMMPVSTSEAMQQALILALRQVSDGQGLINKSLEKLTERVDSIHLDVNTLKAQDFEREISKVETHVDSCIDRLSNAMEKANTAHSNNLEKMVAQALVYRAKADAEREALRLETVRTNGRIDEIKGRLMPLLAVGGLIVTVVVTYVMEKFLRG